MSGEAVIAMIIISCPCFHLYCVPEVSISESSKLRLEITLLTLWWRHKNIFPLLFPSAIATYFKAWVFEAQALTCSVDQSVRVRDSLSRKLYEASKWQIFTHTTRALNTQQHHVFFLFSQQGNLADWIELANIQTLTIVWTCMCKITFSNQTDKMVSQRALYIEHQKWRFLHASVLSEVVFPIIYDTVDSSSQEITCSSGVEAINIGFMCQEGSMWIAWIGSFRFINWEWE